MIVERVREKLRSPCCGARFTGEVDALACAACAARYPVRDYGPDLVPERSLEGDPRWRTWGDVQESLARWRSQTWTGDPQARRRGDEARTVAAALLDRIGPLGEVLDIGCGGAWMAALVQDRGGSYAGLDPRPLRRRYDVPFVAGLSDRLPFTSASFDVCVFFSSLDYSLSPVDTLREARRVLRPGGTVAVASPIHRCATADGERLHVHRFVAGELETLLAATFGVAPSTWWPRPNHQCLWARAGTA